MSEKVGQVYIEASIDTAGAIQAGKVISKTADEIAKEMQRIADAAEEAAAEQEKLAQASIHLAKAQAQAATQSEKAASASQSVTQKLQAQRDSVDAYITALKVENDTLGLNQAELNSYRLAKLAASDAEQKVAANLQAQIDAYRKNMAAVEAAKTQQMQSKNTVDQMIAALKEQAATLGFNARQLVLYKAAQAGASAEDKKAIIQSLNQIDAYRRKEEATRKAAAALQTEAVASDKAGGGMKNLKGVAQNLGFQLQDVAVQAQMGTSAFVIFGQQGSQLASSLGPAGALFGAVIAISAAIGGVLYESMKKAGKAMVDLPEDLQKQLDAIKAKYESVDEASKAAFSQVALGKATAEHEKQEKLVARLRSKYDEITEALRKQGKTSNLGLEITEKQLKKAEEKLKGQSLLVERIGQALSEGAASGAEGITDGLSDADRAVKSLSEQIQIATEKMTEGDLAARKLAAALALDLTNAEKLPADLEAAIVKMYELEEATKKKDETDKTAKNNASEIDKVVGSLDEQYQKLVMNTDAYEEYAAVQQAESAKATPAQIAAIRAKIKALQDERKAIQANSDLQDEIDENVKFEDEEKKKIRTEFESVQSGIQGDLETPAQKAKAELDARLATIKEYNGLFSIEEAKRTEAGIAAEQAYQNKINEIRRSAEVARLDAQRNLLNQTLSMTENVFGNIASAVENAKGRESTAFKVAFLAQKAAAIAMAVLQIELAAASALAPPPFGLGPVAGLPYSQFIRGVGYTGVGIMAAQTIAGGGRLYGGPVQAGGMYPVTEDGRPEILKQGNRQYLLPGSQGGEVISNRDMQPDGGGGITINYNPTIYAQQTDFEEIMAGQPEAVLNAVRAGLAAEGRTF